MSEQRQVFSFDTINHFDHHISASIRGYQVLDDLLINIASFFLKEGVCPVDIGCTSGRLLGRLNQVYECGGKGFDITGANFIPLRGVDLMVQDISEPDFSLPSTNIVFSVFTLQFIQQPKRVEVLRKAFDALWQNGVLVVCEKESTEDAFLQEVFTFSNYDNKRTGFTEKEILDKEADLRKMMNCNTGPQNIELIMRAGFKKPEIFFKSLGFTGYLCRK